MTTTIPASELGLVCEPVDVLHPDDWPNDVRRSRQVFIGTGVDDETGDELTYLSIAEDGKYAAVVLDLEDLRRVVNSLSGNLESMTEGTE